MDPYQENQPPYPQHQPQQPHPRQPHYGHYQQQPQYGPPQDWGPPQPPKKSKVGLILGIVGASIVLLCVLAFAGCSALVNELNGGGGSHTEKAAAMMAAADSVPESDWVSTGRSDPNWESGCVSIDTHCLKLIAGWSVDHEVSASEIASRLGLDMDRTKVSGDCLKETPYDGNSATTVCVTEEPDGTYEVSLSMTRK
ncbi:hypothetical protein [Pseudarthrobacter sp. BIM B-2242]|uniref:hypothetical protein n=1 Tax=Pseudarthrobacter sp. BIM B-2242 TaxID=2772401 RepID=UPI00168A4CB3|nr:hypothetical protein [Pseudarthrobacter sp. BIM B-2242]QOD05842.1 hypothetical protein IDT60_22900 [Pseudarthrobacter sp. BIM B-2242]